MSVKRVGIVGSGIMGSGIAETAAVHGFEVVLRSRAQGTADAMVAGMSKSLAKQVDKGKLAAEHITSLERIHVDTDKNGVVWLSGTASTQKAADKAVSIARETDRVTDVHSDIRVKSAG